jgi:hypothetical protein
MRWAFCCFLCAVGCTQEAPPTVSGDGHGHDGVTIGRPPGAGGSGGSPGADGGADAEVDGGEPGGSCNNESDLGAIEGANDRLRDIARDCGVFLCGNLVGNGELYGECVSTCVQNGVQGLSIECAACYGELERCGHDAFCRARCLSNTCSMIRMDCLGGADCFTEFESCRGLPGNGC